jgi:threonylcarbamoyladenosine tRNA methylthiotransferase MtaB
MAVSFHVENFGCRAARADGEAVSSRLHSEGLCTGEPSAAEVVVVNTCSVTAEADRAARAFIRRTHRRNPQAKIVVTGCYAQRAPEELAGLAGVAAVIGNSHKALAPEIITGLLERTTTHPGNDLIQIQMPKNPERAISEPMAPPQVAQVVWADDRFAHSFLEEAQITPGAQTRPNLKIQEGCGNRCTFCVIPATRGPSKSLSAAAVLLQVEGFIAASGKELVLSGINLGRWGRDLSGSSGLQSLIGIPGFPPIRKEREWMGHPDFLETPTPRTLAGLLRTIFEQTELPRLRLSSIEPMDWDAELIAIMAEYGGKRLARHAHLPLQSGSDAVLRRMHRRYRPWHYAEKVAALLKAAGPELTLGADVMVGFPGESDAEFEETCAFIQALPFGYLHLFPFSPRPGTPGWAMHAERPVQPAVVSERMAALRTLAAEKSRAHRRQFIGQELEAITLNTPAEMAARGLTAALTENFLPVELEGRWEANQLARVQVNALKADETLEAAVVEPQRLSNLLL